jgi:hypothetical protein
MSDAQWSRHGKIIPQSIVSPLLQSRCRARLHHQSYILHQLAHAWSYFSSPDANHHALWVSPSLVCRRGFGSAIIGAHMSAFLGSSSCHLVGFFGVMWSIEDQAGKICFEVGNFALANQRRDLDKKGNFSKAFILRYNRRQPYAVQTTFKTSTCRLLRGERSMEMCLRASRTRRKRHR